MRFESVVLTILAVTGFWLTTCDGAITTKFKLCGRKLGVFMSQICYSYNSPSWDTDPSVVDHAQTRRKRELGIADLCCKQGCTWDQLGEYCLISPKYMNASPFDVTESHAIEDRSAEKISMEVPAEVAVGNSGERSNKDRGARRGEAREVGDARRRGYGRGRCRCRRRRRSGRRHESFMGNMDSIKDVDRAAPIVGTVSPLLTLARTMYTDLPSTDRRRYTYVVYAQP